MGRVYVEIDGVKIKIAEIGRGWVRLEVSTPDAATRVSQKMVEGDIYKLTVTHEHKSGSE